MATPAFDESKVTRGTGGEFAPGGASPSAARSRAAKMGRGATAGVPNSEETQQILSAADGDWDVAMKELGDRLGIKPTSSTRAQLRGLAKKVHDTGIIMGRASRGETVDMKKLNDDAVDAGADFVKFLERQNVPLHQTGGVWRGISDHGANNSPAPVSSNPGVRRIPDAPSPSSAIDETFHAVRRAHDNDGKFNVDAATAALAGRVRVHPDQSPELAGHIKDVYESGVAQSHATGAERQPAAARTESAKAAYLGYLKDESECSSETAMATWRGIMSFSAEHGTSVK